jgi:F0F1-type ATP synthase membrane subunit b/b'
MGLVLSGNLLALVLYIIIGLLMGPVLGLGAEAVRDHFWHALTSNLVNFVLLLSILVYFTRVPIREAFKNRSEEISKSVQQNKEGYEETFEEIQKIERLLQNLKSERTDQLEQAQLDASKLIEIEKSHALRFSKHYMDDVERILRSEAVLVKKTLMLELLNLAMQKLAEDAKQDSPGLNPAYLSQIKKMGNSTTGIMSIS